MKKILLTLLSLLFCAITFAAGDYIGIYIVPLDPLGGAGAQIKDPIEIEGTIYLRFDNTNENRTFSQEFEW